MGGGGQQDTHMTQGDHTGSTHTAFVPPALGV